MKVRSQGLFAPSWCLSTNKDPKYKDIVHEPAPVTEYEPLFTVPLYADLPVPIRTAHNICFRTEQWLLALTSLSPISLKKAKTAQKAITTVEDGSTDRNWAAQVLEAMKNKPTNKQTNKQTNQQQQAAYRVPFSNRVRQHIVLCLLNMWNRQHKWEHIILCCVLKASETDIIFLYAPWTNETDSKSYCVLRESEKAHCVVYFEQMRQTAH